jgi:hypothetical protein
MSRRLIVYRLFKIIDPHALVGSPKENYGMRCFYDVLLRSIVLGLIQCLRVLREYVISFPM